MSTAAARKLRILCFHGYLQDSFVFKTRIAALKRKLKNVATLDFLDGPFEATPLERFQVDQNEETPKGKGWWTFDGTKSIGYEQAVEYVANYMKQNGPYDGLLGFSQGGTMACYLALLQQQQKFSEPFHFVISVAGGFPTDESMKKEFESVKITLPSLIIYGKGDQVVLPRETLK